MTCQGNTRILLLIEWCIRDDGGLSTCIACGLCKLVFSQEFRDYCMALQHRASGSCSSLGCDIGTGASCRHNFKQVAI